MKKKSVERYTGITLVINPIFNIFGLIYLTAKIKNLGKLLTSDRANLFFILAMVLTGIPSVIFSFNKSVAFMGYFIPFVLVWLYIIGRWGIKDPTLFIQDTIRGAMFLSGLTIIAKILHLEWSIGNFRILHDFTKNSQGYGEILYYGHNILGMLIQVGLVGAFGSILIYWKEKKYLVENIVAFILCTCAMIISGSRGGMLGSLAGIFFLIFGYGVYAIMGTGLLTSVLVVFSKRFLTLFQDPIKKGEWVRVEIWKTAFRIIKAYPIFGVGSGNYLAVFDRFKPANAAEMIRMAGGRITCPQSLYLTTIISWGFVGGLVILGWQFYMLIRPALKGLTPLQRVIFAIIIAFLVQVIFDDLFVVHYGVLLGLLSNSFFQTQSPAFNKTDTMENHVNV